MAHERIKPEFLFDEEKIKQLKQIAPECFEDGKLNFETLRQNLGDWAQDEEDGELEHFGLFWPGKKDARRLATIPPEGTLEPVYGEGLKSDGTPDDHGVNDSKNIFIEGENLEVLKILQKSYANKIKMIYIDPPYNTGNDFVYDDDFTEPLQEYLRRTGQVDEEGKPLTTNKKSDGRFHSKWLSMMYPRLRLARNLLKEDGVIFVSIDDNEVHNLRAIMNEIFGEENFISNIIWEKRFTRSNNSKTFATLTEHIICFRKSEELAEVKEPRNEKADSTYSNPDNDPRGVWTSVSYVNPATKEKRPNLAYTLTNPITQKEVIHPTHAWKYERKKYEIHASENRLYWGKEGNNTYPRLKRFLSEMDGGMVPVNFWNRKDAGTTDEASKLLEEIMGSKVFDFPKPHTLIQKAIRIGTNENDVILDFFGGSGTTAHSVFQQNIEDLGNRKFIIVQLPEMCDEKSEGKNAGYETISQLSLDRVKKTSAFLRKEINKEGLDFGVNAFRLSYSNYKKWSDVQGEDISQLENSLDLFNSSPLRDDWNKNKLITELILLEGFPLDATQTKSQIGTNEIVKVESEMVPNTLLICLDDEIEESLIDQLELDNTSTFICLDSAISNQNKLRLSDKGLIKTI